MSWAPLRDFLYADLAAQIDHAILHDPDPELRALLAVHRERALTMLVDRAELITLRRLMAERDAAAEHEQHVVPINGRKHRLAQ